MSSFKKSTNSTSNEDDAAADELRRGPWTLEEDTLLVHYIARHGEGRWNSLAKRAGLRRTGKSCRLRWLNYLKPDVKRGNLTPQEQLLILDLHSKWGNRWSKIAQHLPGRTDNEIKNYWRTRVQKQARHLKIDANSTAFQEIIRCFWIPRLLQKIESGPSNNSTSSTPSAMLSQISQTVSHQPVINNYTPHQFSAFPPLPQQEEVPLDHMGAIVDHHEQNSDSEHGASSCISSAESMNVSKMSQLSEYPTSNNNDYTTTMNVVNDCYYVDSGNCYDMEAINIANMSAVPGELGNPASGGGGGGGDRHMAENDWAGGYDFGENMWSMDELWQFRYLQGREI